MNKTIFQKSIDVFRSLLISSAIILIAGIVLGTFLVPWELDRIWTTIMIVVVMIIFFIGVYMQYRREKSIESHMNEEISKLKERIGKLEPPIEDKSIPKIDIIPKDNSKSKFGKFLESEKNNVIILVSAGIALTFSTTPMDLSWKFGSGLIASGLFIWAIFRRAKSNYGIQNQIDDLQKQIDNLKKPNNNDESRSDNQ